MVTRPSARNQLSKPKSKISPAQTKPNPPPRASYTILIDIEGEGLQLLAPIASKTKAIRQARKERQKEINRQTREGDPRSVVARVIMGGKEVFREPR